MGMKMGAQKEQNHETNLMETNNLSTHDQGKVKTDVCYCW